MDFKISGKVVKGDGYGKKLGFPTVNLDIGDQKIPEAGVYAGEAIMDGKKYRAGIVISPKEKNQSKVEAHLIGYDGDAYAKLVTLELGNFLRGYKTFNTEEELINQIKKDIEQC